jgi:tetratricopeptide (TPR) repeat protein
VAPDPQAARRQLERLLASNLFARSEQLSRLLRFLVERHLEGRDGELKESVIGVEVFGRRPEYNPKFDPIVRTEARRLRARLAEYYESAGQSDEYVIELPRGGYVPAIRVASSVGPAGIGRLWRAAFIGVAVLVLAIAGWKLLRRSAAHGEGYDLYLRGRALLKRPAQRGVEESIDLFTQAVSKDGSFAPGYAGVAAGLAARSGFDQFTDSERIAMLEKGWAYAGTAMHLGPRSADAQDAMAMMQARTAQWPQAESSFRRAIRLAPRELLWREHFAVFLLLPLGRKEEAIAELLQAVAIDPGDRSVHFALVSPLRAVGRFEEADSHCLRAAENDQQAGTCWSASLRRQGKVDQAIRTLEASQSGHVLEPGAAQALGVEYARAGRREDAERMAALAPRLASKAQIYAALGDKDRTIAVLDRMVPMGPTRLGREFLNASNFAFLRSDPRLSDLRKKLGLPE